MITSKNMVILNITYGLVEQLNLMFLIPSFGKKYGALIGKHSFKLEMKLFKRPINIGLFFVVYAKAWSRSAMISSICSIPTDNLT